MSSKNVLNRISLELIELYRDEFLNIIDEIPGPKILIWDEVLASTVGIVAQYGLLKEHGVESMHSINGAFKLDFSKRNVTSSLVFITRPLVESLKRICEQIRKFESGINVGIIR
ncbi:hypothetical protein ACOME3_002508 [Neoechinorhynchus agilis]